MHSFFTHKHTIMNSLKAISKSQKEIYFNVLGVITFTNLNIENSIMKGSYLASFMLMRIFPVTKWPILVTKRNFSKE